MGSSYFNKWQGSGNLTDRSISQQITGLPAGKYRLSVRTGSGVIHKGASLFANSDKTDMTTVVGNGTVSVTTDIADGLLTLGVELKNYQSNDCKFDHFTLEYLGNTVTGIKSVLNEEAKTVVDEHTVYSLSGQRVSHPAKGLYIVGGKKRLVSK